MSRSMRLMMGSALLISSLACSISVLAETATDHARFYPDGTQFFTDINAPTDYSHRTLEWAAKQIDTMSPSETPEEAPSPKTRWVKKKVKGRWVNVAVKAPQAKPAVAKKPTKSATDVLTELETLVEPVMSVGLWDLKGDAKSKKVSVSFAITINTKPTLTAEYIQSKSDKKTKAPVVIDNIGTMFEATSKSSPNILLTNDNHMVLTDSVADMQQIIDVLKTSQPALQQNSVYKESVALLNTDSPAKPDGTFFWNVRDFSLEKMGFTPTAMGLIPPPRHTDDDSNSDETSSEKPEPSKKELMTRAVFEQYAQNYEQLLKAFPYGTASLRFAPGDMPDQIVLDVLCPYSPQNIINTRLKTALNNYMVHQGPTKLGQLLPENTMFAMEAKNAADYIWLLTEMISTPEMRDQWKNEMPPMLKATKFSVKKHMLGFLDGEFGVALTPKALIPGFVTMFNLNKDTKEFLDWSVELATQGEKGIMITEGKPLSSQDWMKVVTAPKVPFELAYGSLDQTTLVTGIKPAIDDMRQLIDTQAGNGSSALDTDVLPSLTPLSQSPVFKTLTQTMPEKTQYWGYVNLNEFAKWTDRNFGSVINSKVKTSALKKAHNSGKKVPVLESKEPLSVAKILQPVQGVTSWGSMVTPSLYKGRLVFLMAPGLMTRKTDSPL